MGQWTRVENSNDVFLRVTNHTLCSSTSLMFIHLPLIYFAPPPRLLIDFKNSKWLTYFCILLCICYCFSHLIGLRSVTWLSLFYKFTRFFIYFLFLSDEGPMLETLDYTIRIGSIPTFLYFDLYLYSAYAGHFVYVNTKARYNFVMLGEYRLLRCVRKYVLFCVKELLGLCEQYFVWDCREV